MNQHEIGRGVALSVTASMLFALLSGYASWLKPLDGLDIFAWRIVWTLPGALLLVAMRKRWPQLSALLRRLAREPRTLAAFLAVAAQLGVQLWIFLWAPLHGYALDVSLGYFLLPLVMVLVGRFYYREHLDALQWAGVAFAVVGVAHELFITRALSWPTLVVAVGYPPYFMMRRRLNLEPLVSFAVEMMALAPFALAMLCAGNSFSLVAHRPLLWLLLPGLGALSTVALGSYLRSSRYLPLALFGILGYLEPVLLVGVAVLMLGEPFSARQLGTYVPIWIAVLLTGIHSARLLRDERVKRRTEPVMARRAGAAHDANRAALDKAD